MLICDALDERDFLKKKIQKAVQHLNLITVKRKKDPKTSINLTVEEFEAQAKSEYQSVMDMIDRYNRINVAIVESNAREMIKTRSGVEMTRAAAIAKKKIFSTSDDFQMLLHQSLVEQLESASSNFRAYSKSKDQLEDKYKTNLTTKEKGLSDEDLKAIEKIVEGETPEMIDPINIKDVADNLANDYNALVKEIDTAIKISNATTYIEI